MRMFRMMKNGRGERSNWLVLLPIFAFGMMIFCCGDDVGLSNSNNSLAGGGIGGTGVSVGSVSSFGGIHSNGIHFDTNRAEIIIEGNIEGLGDTAAQEHLKVGQMVRIEGDINDDGTGVAGSIYYEKTIEGPVTSVESLDPYTSRIEVLGQTVIADSQTQFLNTSLSSLNKSHKQFLEISGYFNDDGSLKAGFISKKERGITVTVTGTVSDLDAEPQHFQMGKQTIDFSRVSTPMPAMENGDKVRVKGTITGWALEAHEVTAWAPLDFRLKADRIKIEGVVHRAETSPDDEIHVDGVPVRLDEDTIYEGIDNGDQLDTGLDVLVHGALKEGVVQAETIEVKSDSIRIEGVVSNIEDVVSKVDAEESTFTLDDRLIRINRTTTIYKHSNTACGTQTRIVDGVEEGDDIVVYGWIRTDHSITAKFIKINPESTDCYQKCYWDWPSYYDGYVLYCPESSYSSECN